jgi:acetyl-CoA carboxylase alpha subunit
MQPAIPASAAAHIVPLRANELRKDDIVLARLPHGPMVLHRIHRICDDRVQLKGDAMRRRDAVVPRSAILGRCDEVEIDGIVYRAADRPRDSVSLLKAAARSRLRRLVTVNRA